MIIKDRVYGEEIIDEDVLIDLINSKPIQRLKKISQWGMPEEYYHKNSFSRYDHSIGVLVLLRRLNAGLDEQIAGLLHDVSHTAFSHVVDWVMGDPLKEDYQDKIHLKIIENSEIPFILERHGFDYRKISEVERFSLLEKPSPGLCADRIDYALRELETEKEHCFVKSIFLDLTVRNNQIVFKSKEIAELFGKEYARLNNEHWAGKEARARYYILANILKKAIERKIISKKHLNLTDYEVIEMLYEKGDDEILNGLELLKKGFKIHESDSEGILLKKKFRYIDPEILFEEGVACLSEISEDYKFMLDEEKKNSGFDKYFLILDN